MNMKVSLFENLHREMAETKGKLSNGRSPNFAASQRSPGIKLPRDSEARVSTVSDACVCVSVFDFYRAMLAQSAVMRQ